MKNKNYITLLEDDKKGFRYGSGIIIYTERFMDGRLLCAAYQDNGIPVFEHTEIPDKPSFDLVIDGESMYFGWEYVEFESSGQSNDIITGTLTLKHSFKPVILKIITSCCGYGFYKRRMEITNTSENENLTLTSITPMSGCLWNMKDNLRENMKDNSIVPYSVGRFKENTWSNEGNYEWEDIPLNAELCYSSMRGRSGFGGPFFVLRNNIYGGYFLCHLGWSANWKAGFFSEFSNSGESGVRLSFFVMPSSPSPARVIAPGEVVKSPEVHFGMDHYDFDSIIQNYHTYLRNSALYIVGDGLQPVIYNQAGYMQPSEKQPDMSEEGLMGEVDIAAEIGAELFMVDASWYGNKGSNWYLTTGNWYTGDCLPNDLFPVFDYARKKGLKCGLWVEIESAGSESELAKTHPDWFITRHGKLIERILDLAKPEVRDYAESEITRIIERYNLDMFRLDYNIDQCEGGFNQKDGKYENTLWRHIEAIYDIFDRIGRRFPHLQLENCSSGGGRTDVGMVSRFTTTWISDWFRMPRTVRILNGMSMALPPEYINRCFGVGIEGSYRGNADTLMHVAIMAHPAIIGIARSIAEVNTEVMACVKKYIKIYKNFIRPFHRTAKVYHHTPVIPGADGSGYCALEYVSEDRKKAIAAVFRLVNAKEDIYRLKFRGLDKSLNYQIQIEPEGILFFVNGFVLSNEGLDIRLDSALTSSLILLTS